jgi:hypothetical protein
MRIHRFGLRAAAVTAACTLALACTVPQKKAAVAASVDDPERRRESFEATLRVLDENPEYVDEFFRLALERHPATLGRFLRDTVRTYDDSEKLVEWSAAELVQEPPSLHRILVATLDAAAEREPARAAIARAIGDRPALAARALAEEPEVALEVMREMGELGGSALVERLRSALGE